MPEYVDAACHFGLDAVLYTSVMDLVKELRLRGVELNY